MSEILRYRINNWSQLKDCLSNNSNTLHAYFTAYLGGDRLHGHQIVIEDDTLGVLFAGMIDGGGYYISENDPEGQPIYFLNDSDILRELTRFGFIIEFVPETALPEEQINVLESCQSLGCDYVLRLVVKDNDSAKSHMVAIDSRKGSEWLAYGKEISAREYSYLLSSGTAIDLERFRTSSDWSWLSSLTPISSILTYRT